MKVEIHQNLPFFIVPPFCDSTVFRAIVRNVYLRLPTGYIKSRQKYGRHNFRGIPILLFPNIWVKVRGNQSLYNLTNRSTGEYEFQLK